MKTIEEYPIEIFDNHTIALINGKKVLLDTGSPKSISDGCSLTILDKTYNFLTNILGINIEKISNLLGTKVNVFLGMDILKALNFFIDWDKKLIRFSSELFDLEGTYIPLNLSKGAPIVTLQVEGKNLNVFVDTGAKISYLHPKILSNYTSVGRETDFYFIIGQFSTDIYEIPVVLGGHRFVVRSGILPNILQNFMQMVMNLTDTYSVLGSDVFRYFTVCFNCTTNELILTPL